MKELQKIALLLGTALLFSSPVKAKQWSDADYQFFYPSSLHLSRTPTHPKCHVLQKTKKDRTKGFFLKICKIRSGFPEVLESSIFYPVDDQWMAAGAMDEQIAIREKMPDESELIETQVPPSCGVKDAETGFHAAGGECYRAYVGNGKIVISLESDGVDKNFIMMRKITRSVFLKVR